MVIYYSFIHIKLGVNYYSFTFKKLTENRNSVMYYKCLNTFLKIVSVFPL